MGLQNYTEALIQFGYVIMFVAALPATSIGGFIAIYIDTKIRAWNLIFHYQRPVPRGAENIGIW